MDSYSLSRDWFDWCFENPEKIKPTHTALYFFAIEHCNRLGWKVSFGLPTQMAMDAIGVKNWRTYSSAFEDIVNWGFFKVYERSKNQYSATVIGIVKNTKANTKALTKAMQKHVQKQSSSIAVITKPRNQETNKQGTSKKNKDFFTQIIPDKMENKLELKQQSELKSIKAIRQKPDVLQFHFTSVHFMQAWSDLLSLAKWKKKPLSALQLALNQLSRYDEKFAIGLIEKAHAGNYQGVVFDDTDEKYQRWLKMNQSNMGKIKISSPVKNYEGWD